MVGEVQPSQACMSPSKEHQCVTRSVESGWMRRVDAVAGAHWAGNGWLPARRLGWV